MDAVAPLFWHTDNPSRMEMIAQGVLAGKGATEVWEQETFQGDAKKRQKFEKEIATTPESQAMRLDLLSANPSDPVAAAEFGAIQRNFAKYALSRAQAGISPTAASKEFFGAFVPVKTRTSTILLPSKVKGPGGEVIQVTEKEAEDAGRFFSSLERGMRESIHTGQPLLFDGVPHEVIVPSVAFGRDPEPGEVVDILRQTGRWVGDGERTRARYMINDFNGRPQNVQVRKLPRPGSKDRAVTRLLEVPYWRAIRGGDAIRAGEPSGMARYDYTPMN